MHESLSTPGRRRGPRRTLGTALPGTVAAALAALALPPVPANAESIETQLANGARSCAMEVIGPIGTLEPGDLRDTMTRLHANVRSRVTERDGQPGACERAVLDSISRLLYEVPRDASSAAVVTKAELASLEVGNVIAAGIGVLQEQFGDLAGLRISLGTAATDPGTGIAAGVGGAEFGTGVSAAPDSELGCLGCVEPNGLLTVDQADTRLREREQTDEIPADDRVSKFKWHNSARITFKGSEGCQCLDGKSLYGLYKETQMIDNAYRFWALSQGASLNPINGHKIKKILSAVRPQDGQLGEEYDPMQVREYGDGGSMTLGATLEGSGSKDPQSGKSIGGGFTIGRTWNFSEGSAGGSQFSDDHTYTAQFLNGGGSPYPKSAVGVSTWRAPRSNELNSWYIELQGTTKK